MRALSFRTLLRRRPSRIGRRLFAFNLLVLFVPIAGLLYLDVYEARLLETQERGMVHQARLVAAAVGGSAVPDVGRAVELFTRIDVQGDARIRIFDAAGRLVADSGRYARRTEPAAPDAYSQVTDPRRRVLYRVGARLVQLRDALGSKARRLLGRSLTRPSPDPSGGTPPEVRAALAGRYGAATRPTAGQRSLTLSSAVPVRDGEAIVGAVVVSQTTYRLLQALYDVRLRLFEIVLLSLAAAAALTWIASSTIVNPILRLQQAAAALSARRGSLGGMFGRVDRRDEIGDLARGLEDLARRLDAQIKLLESFAADVSHEFRNPLASIRTAAETIAASTDPGERERFLAMLVRDVDRLDRLVDGVRELARIDAQLSTGERQIVDAGEVLEGVVRGRSLVGSAGIRLSLPTEALPVSGSHDRLQQVFDNLIDNAVSLSPAGAIVEVTAFAQGSNCLVSVEDRGPGIPAAHFERLFDRFFSYRPSSDRRSHMGLGLAIAEAIVTGYGGEITARNREGGGAVFEVRLPLAAAGRATGRRSQTLSVR